MCGIAGIIFRNSKVDRKKLVAANKSMYHRGPDSSGIWVSENKKIGLSQTRLSIVDLNVRANQPMILRNGEYVIVFNGEIYNYLELKRELDEEFKFETTSDTEVLLYMYIKYGTRLFEKIEGMFAFAIYDKKKNSVLIARDIVGQKPLVYSETPDGVIFASEIRGILAMHKGLSKDVDVEAIKVFLTPAFSQIPAPFTIYKNIKKLLPAHYMIVVNGKLVANKQYYKLKKNKELSHKGMDYVKDITNEMKPEDIDYASLLSGGVDSAFVVSSLANEQSKKGKDVYTLRVGNEDIDFDRSKYFAKKYKLKQTVVDIGKVNFLESAAKQVHYMGEPYFHTTSAYSDSLYAKVREKHKVVFVGAGGDEVYYGYDNKRFIAVDILLRVRKLVPRVFFKTFLNKYQFIKNSDLSNFKYNLYVSQYESMDKIFANNNKAVYAYFKTLNEFVTNISDFDNYVDLSYMAGLFMENAHSLTIQSDLIGMMHSIEVRCPFLERRVIEHGYSLPLRKKINFKHVFEGKKILREFLVKILSKKFVYGKKIGFGVEMDPIEVIYNTNKKFITQKIKEISRRKIFSQKEILSLIDSEANIRKNMHIILKLVVLELWFKEFANSF